MKDGNIKITVKGSGDLMGDETVTVTAEGKLYLKNGFRYILYDISDGNEQEISGRHLLKIGANQLEMTRTVNKMKTKFTYILDEKTETEYQSPFGKILLTVRTTSYEMAETENNILIKIGYYLQMDDDSLNAGSLEIEAKLL